MADIRDLHDWDLTPLQARQLQEKLTGRVVLRLMRKKPKFVAGLDCSLDKRRGLIFAAAVIFELKERALPARTM